MSLYVLTKAAITNTNSGPLFQSSKNLFSNLSKMQGKILVHVNDNVLALKK